MRRVVSCIAVCLLIISCGEDKKPSKNGNGNPGSGGSSASSHLSLVPNLDSLPSCSDNHTGMIVYVQDISAFRYCNSIDWSELDMRGPQGPAGEQGTPGEKGAPGEKGPQGQTGEKGANGETGTQGPKGDKGDTGNTGAAGAAGTNGTSGMVKISDASGNRIGWVSLDNWANPTSTGVIEKVFVPELKGIVAKININSSTFYSFPGRCYYASDDCTGTCLGQNGSGYWIYHDHDGTKGRVAIKDYTNGCSSQSYGSYRDHSSGSCVDPANSTATLCPTIALTHNFTYPFTRPFAVAFEQ